LYFANEGYVLAGVSLHLIGLWLGLFFMFVLPIVEILFVRKIHLKNIGYSALGLLYISLSLGLLTNLRSMFYGSILDIIDKMLVMMIIASLWINDTMAYIVGSFIGRTPISRISPKKTLEGTISGIILAVLIMGWIGYLVSGEFDWESILPWMIIAAIASIAGTFGDLLESKLKRLARVKDSGHIMPGHGGFLDRFDSLLVATPFVWLYVLFIIKS
jgi:phosphatidate cytidylyltransferase